MGVKNGNGRRATVAFGEQRWSLTQMFTDDLPEGEAFRFLSGMTHSRPWAQLWPDLARPSKEPGISLVKVEIDVPAVVETLTKVMNVHDDNIRLWFEAAGIPGDVLATAKS